MKQHQILQLGVLQEDYHQLRGPQMFETPQSWHGKTLRSCSGLFSIHLALWGRDFFTLPLNVESCGVRLLIIITLGRDMSTALLLTAADDCAAPQWNDATCYSSFVIAPLLSKSKR